jgi:hypothetical protein
LSGHKVLGYQTLGQFLAQPDLGLAESSFHRAVSMWKTYYVDRSLPREEIAQLEPSKARETMPAVIRGQVRPQTAVNDIKALSHRDIVAKYRQKNIEWHGQQPDGSTPLDASTEPQWAKCPTCGTVVSEQVLNGAAVNSTATELPDG